MIKMIHSKDEIREYNEQVWFSLVKYFDFIKPDKWITLHEFNKTITSKNKAMINQVPYITLKDLEVMEKKGLIELVKVLNDIKETLFYGEYIVQLKLKGD